MDKRIPGTPAAPRSHRKWRGSPMNRTTIAAIFADQDKLGGKTVTVCGWARTIRDMKTFGFIELNDGSCF